jgi:pyruvate formate lyase activating enzyme
LNGKYDRLSGVKTDLAKIRQSIDIIRESGIPYEFRTTVIPGLLNSKDIGDISREIRGAEKFVLQQFVPENCRDESLCDLKPFSREELEEMARISREFVPETLVRGV